MPSSLQSMVVCAKILLKRHYIRRDGGASLEAEDVRGLDIREGGLNSNQPVYEARLPCCGLKQKNL
jgi:hypothetical protein